MTDVLDSYPIQTHDKLRYFDTDQQGHISNSAYPMFFETGRVEFMERIRTDGESCAMFVVARVLIDFLAETHWPGDVKVGTKVKSIGNSSLTVEQVMVHNDQVVARSEGVIVQLDQETKKSRKIGDELRALLEAHQ